MRTPTILAAVAFLSVTPAVAQEEQPTVLDTLNEMQEGTVPSIADVQAIFDSVYATACPRFPDGPYEDPQSFDIRFRYESDDETQPDRLLALYQFFCFAGAYNASYVFFSWDAIEGLRPVALPTPQLDVQYPPDDYEMATITSLAIIGYLARPLVTNASFDPATKTISSYSAWRGIGDASSGGTWVFKEGDFVLETYFVDPTYDGEAIPRTIIDYTKPDPVKW